MSSVLIVEDERHLAAGLRFNLEAEGYSADIAEDGERALELLSQSEYDVVVLDVMLPGIEGFEVASRLRAQGNFVPILMLTARGRAEDVLRGFESGADDYLPKPFELNILLARVKGLVRRGNWGRRAVAADHYSFAGKTIDFDKLELRAHDRVVRLTAMEASVLRYFADHAGSTVTRKKLLEDVWGLHAETDTRAVDNFITRIRRHVEDVPSQPRHLITMRGLGYRFVPNPERDA